MLSVTYETFDEVVLGSERLVVVDFFSVLCGPCKVLTPLIEKVSTDYDMDFAKINIDDCPELAEAFSIRSIPTLLIFHKEEPVAQVSGIMTEDDLRLQLEYALALTDDQQGTDSRIG